MKDIFYSECCAGNQNKYKPMKIFNSFKTLYDIYRAYEAS